MISGSKKHVFTLAHECRGVTRTPAKQFHVTLVYFPITESWLLFSCHHLLSMARDAAAIIGPGHLQHCSRGCALKRPYDDIFR